MSAYKVLVCGGRDYPDRDRVFEVLDIYRARIGPSMLMITGGARGADEWARQWAVDRKVDHMVLYAKWDAHGRGAGPKRNRRMAKKNPQRVIAFHTDIAHSRGTKDMVTHAAELGIKWKVFK